MFDRSPFDGGRRIGLGRKPQWYCNRGRDSRNRHHRHIQHNMEEDESEEEGSLMDLLWPIVSAGIVAMIVLIGAF